MEIKEAVMLAMTVGAHKIKLMAEKGLPANSVETQITETPKPQVDECKT